MRSYLPFVLFAGILVLAFLGYRPGLHGGFVFDDVINIAENQSLKVYLLDVASLEAAAFSVGEGISGRPLSMLSFALNYYLAGPAPYGFKLVNLAIHLLNGLCIFILTRLVLEIYRRHAPELSREHLRWTSLAVASAWLLHPLNLTGVLYVVQRMASLSALFTLLGLVAYLYGRLRQTDGKFGWGWILSAFLLFTPLAVLSKENGALLPAFMLLAEIVLLNFQASTPKVRMALFGLFAATVVLPAVALLAYSLFEPGWLLVGYNIRDFTLPERLMTEARVLWFYLHLIVVPDISQLGLQHDDIAISRGLLTPYSTLFASAGLLLLAGAAIWFRKRHPIAAFGILFFLLGHSIESSVIALEIAHEHRNYLPMYGILLAAFYYLLSPAWHKDTIRLRQGLVVMLILFFGIVTAIRAGQWADPYELALMEVKHHPDSMRANTEIAYIYASLPAFSPEQMDEHYQFAFNHYQKAAELSSSDTSGLFGMVGLNAGRGKPVEDRWLQELEFRLEHRPFAPAAANSLMNLEKCLADGVCTHSPQVMERLLQAALRNPTLYDKGRSTVLFTWSDFLFRVMHDREAALKAVYQAVELAPPAGEAQLTFVKFLLNLGEPDEAKKQIARLRMVEGMKGYAEQLDELEKLATMPSQTTH
jgi:hypothetical protein